MQFLYFVLAGVLGGVLAGMGMGGGTFLIPALNLFFSYNQAICQSTNVICFIVLGFFCVLIYFKNKLIDIKTAFWISIPACIVSIIFTSCSIQISSEILRYSFAGFIICFGFYYFLSTIIQIIKKKSG